MLAPEELDDALQLADAADGALPHFLNEQRAVPSPARAAAEARAAQEERGRAAYEKNKRKDGPLSRDEFADMCRFLDPTMDAEPRRGRYR